MNAGKWLTSLCCNISNLYQPLVVRVLKIYIVLNLCDSLKYLIFFTSLCFFSKLFIFNWKFLFFNLRLEKCKLGRRLLLLLFIISFVGNVGMHTYIHTYVYTHLWHFFNWSLIAHDFVMIKVLQSVCRSMRSCSQVLNIVSKVHMHSIHTTGHVCLKFLD